MQCYLEDTRVRRRKGFLNPERRASSIPQSSTVVESDIPATQTWRGMVPSEEFERAFTIACWHRKCPQFSLMEILRPESASSGKETMDEPLPINITIQHDFRAFEYGQVY